MNDGLVLDRYRLIERLAVGGSAEVWRAHDEQLDRPVAVKRLHPHLLPDAASRQRLAAEARAAASLSHPVIVDVYDVDATGDSPALVMELVDGESLSARIDRHGPLPAREAVAVTADVAEALYHAHQRGVIHRDVKPGNVLIGRDGRTRLVDFGIAHSLAESAERLTLTGTVIGTLHSMAPEQLAGGPITPRTDLYGIGAVLHEALTGRPPYPARSPLGLAEQQRAGPANLGEMEPALAAIVASCLAYDPADRPLHAGALGSALRAWLAEDPEPALALAPLPGAGPVDTDAVTQVVGAVPVTAADADDTDRPAAPVPRATRRASASPLLLALGLVAAGLAIAAVAWALANGGGAGDAASTPTPVSTPVATAVPTAAPTVQPTPTPKWLGELVRKVTEECGAGIAAEVEAVIAPLSEDAAKDYAEQQVDACKEANEGEGNGNEGGGNGDEGGGNGNDGGGNGNDN